MYQGKINLVEDSIYAYLVVNTGTNEIIQGNKLAKTYYYHDDIYPTLEEIFPSKDKKSVLNALEKFGENPSFSMRNIPSVKVTGDPFLCDLEICDIDSENLLAFLVIKEKIPNKDLYMKELLELSSNAVFVLDYNKDFTVSYGNTQFFQCICMEKQEFFEKKQGSFLGLLQQDKVESFVKLIETQLLQDNECDTDIELTFDGEHFQLFRFNVVKVSLEQGEKLFGVLIHMKKQCELMKKIEYDQQYFDIMQEFSKDLLFRIDIKKKTLVHRGDISKFMGLLPEMTEFPESMRKTTLIHPDDLDGYISFAHKLMHGMSAIYESRIQFMNGTYERFLLQGKVLFDSEGNPVQVVGKCENIQKYADIKEKANYDSLTTALNKQSFRELVGNIFERAVERDRFALLFLDFDDFKGVNDTMGKEFGDFLLETAGKRILNSVRNHDRVGRVGGDEFVVFFQHAPNPEAILERAGAILSSLRREFNNGNESYSIRASIGIALFPEHGTSYDTLYHKADKALYVSKKLGKDTATIYSSE